MSVYAPSNYYKIINIQFPSSIISTSLKTAIALQNNQIQQNQQEVSVIIADTNQMIAEITASTHKLLSYANNTANQIIGKSITKATQIVSLSRGKGIEYFFQELNITDTNDKDSIINTFAILDNNSNFALINNIGNAIIRI